MKFLKTTAILFLFLATSCTSIKATSDYDTKTDFSKFKTFAFYKKGIAKVDLSNLDKKRILHAIENELQAKGLTKSTHPDILVNIFTKSKEKIDHYDNSNSGWGYYSYRRYGPINEPTYNSVSTSVVGTLFIDIIDVSKKDLAWQGAGIGFLNYVDCKEKKNKLFKEFVSEILKKYPPMDKNI